MSDTFTGYRTFYNIYDEPVGTEHICATCQTLVLSFWSHPHTATCKCMNDGTQLVPGLPIFP